MRIKKNTTAWSAAAVFLIVPNFAQATAIASITAFGWTGTLTGISSYSQCTNMPDTSFAYSSPGASATQTIGGGPITCTPVVNGVQFNGGVYSTQAATTGTPPGGGYGFSGDAAAITFVHLGRVAVTAPVSVSFSSLYSGLVSVQGAVPVGIPNFGQFAEDVIAFQVNFQIPGGGVISLDQDFDLTRTCHKGSCTGTVGTDLLSGSLNLQSDFAIPIGVYDVFMDFFVRSTVVEAAIPEPGTLALLALGLPVLGFAKRKSSGKQVVPNR